MQEQKNLTPRCIGLIMDGNRRWAKSQGLSVAEGHTAGFEKLKEVLGWAKQRGIENCVLYAFSTENWKRSEAEVSHLLNIFRMLTKELDDQLGTEVRIRFAGDITRFPEDLQDSIASIEERTRDRGPFTCMVGLSYGGRAELVAAAQKMVDEGGEVTEERMANALWTAGFPDPDLIIRTSGEMRLSNFLPWQSVYSELFFPKTHWPALTESEFDAILAEFRARKRNFGS